jgi:hypothetical protein
MLDLKWLSFQRVCEGVARVAEKGLGGEEICDFGKKWGVVSDEWRERNTSRWRV